jgi:lia operon protein LiaI
LTKRGWMVVAAIVLAIIVLSSLGAIIGLGAGAVLAYFGWRQATLNDQTIMKVLWWVILLIGVCLTVGSLPGIIGVGALYLLVKLYEKWKEMKEYDFEV